VWDLNKEDCEPYFTLGGIDESAGAKKKKTINSFNKKQTQEVLEDTHSDAVMALSLNPHQQEYLASGSADTTVRIWDLEE